MYWLMIGRLHTSPGLKKIKNITLDVWCRQRSIPMSDAQHSQIHKDASWSDQFCTFLFSIVNMSTRWCSHHRINYKSHRGGCGTSATTTMKPFPILRSLKKKWQTYGTNFILSTAISTYHNTCKFVLSNTNISHLSKDHCSFSLNMEGIILDTD